MNDIEHVLAADLEAIAGQVRPSPAPVAQILGRGRGVVRRRRTAAAAAGAAGLAVVVLGGGWLTGARAPVPLPPPPAASTTPTPTSPTPTSSPSPATPTPDRPTRTPSITDRATPPPGVTSGPGAMSAPVRLSGAEGVARVRSAGTTVKGIGLEAWSWEDGNGTNVVLTTRSVDGRRADGVVDAATLRAYHVVDREGTSRLLRRIEDAGYSSYPPDVPGGPPKRCEGDFLLDFVSGALTVADLDRDGIGEVSLAWFANCNTDISPPKVKIAVVSNGTLWILRGQGFAPGVADDPAVRKQLPAPSWTASPARDTWPKAFLADAVSVFDRYFA